MIGVEIVISSEYICLKAVYYRFPEHYFQKKTGMKLTIDAKR